MASAPRAFRKLTTEAASQEAVAHQAAAQDDCDDLLAQSPTLRLCTSTIVGAFAVLGAIMLMSLQGGRPRTRIFTEEELSAAAKRQRPLLLVVVGDVYDVSAGKEFYAAARGNEYQGFADGADASRAFLTADFEADATDDLSGLLPGQCLGIEHWRQFYANHTKYVHVGRLHGRYYDAHGAPTDALRAYGACVERGLAARRAVRAVASRAAACRAEPPPTEERYAHGTWKSYHCEPPLAPRRLLLPERGEECICIDPAEAVAGGWEADSLGMDEDPELPQVHDRRGCTAEGHSCTVRIG